MAAFGSAACAGKGGARKALSLLLAAVAFASPLWFTDVGPFPRVMLALAGLLVAFRAIDLARDRRVWPLSKRLWLYTAILDVRAAVREPVAGGFTLVAQAVAYVALGAGGWLVLTELAPMLSGTPAQLVRSLGAVILVYGVADAAGKISVGTYAMLGYRVPPQHRAPILATSIGAFWSQHYNLNISAWLARNIYLPLARRRHLRLGQAAAFAFSALFHAWLVYVALDLEAAAWWGVFFLIHGAAVALEGTVRQQRWPTPLRRIWTVAILLVTSPLFTEPMLRVFGVPTLG